jgi:uncharacterized protein YgiM (DUF1202 family)
MNKFIKGMLVGYVISGIIFIGVNAIKTYNYNHVDSLYEIRIVADYINVRKEPNSYSDKVYEVLHGEDYDVIEVNEEDSKYTWYKIKFSDRRTGWIASDPNQPWVEEVK